MTTTQLCEEQLSQLLSLEDHLGPDDGLEWLVLTPMTQPEQVAPIMIKMHQRVLVGLTSTRGFQWYVITPETKRQFALDLALSVSQNRQMERWFADIREQTAS